MNPPVISQERTLPPIIPGCRGRPFSRSTAPFWAVLGGVVVVFGVHWAFVLGLPWPRCGLRMLTGIPCAFCGSTRSLLALSKGDLLHAFQFNPLVASSDLAMGLWFGVWVADLCLGKNWSSNWAVSLASRRWRYWLFGAIVVNWVYLIGFLQG